MKVRALKWITPRDRVNGPWFTTEDFPQILYRINRTWDDDLKRVVYEVKFMHGYVPARAAKQCTFYLGTHISVSSAKIFAGIHFGQYITEHYLTDEP